MGAAAMFSPCNIPLPRLIEQQREANERSAAKLQQAMQRAAIPVHVADAIRRREAAVLLCLERLQALEAENDSVHTGTHEDRPRQ